MGLEAFPEIESFQKLPRQVIVKGGSSTFDPRAGAELRGIVINNTGHSIRDISVRVVILDDQGMPVQSHSVAPEPAELTQGGIGSFIFRLPSYSQKIRDYYLNTNWKFDDRE